MRSLSSSAAQETTGQHLLLEDRERSCKGRCSKLKQSCQECCSKLCNLARSCCKNVARMLPVLALIVIAVVVALVTLIFVGREDTHCLARGAPPIPKAVLDKPGSPAPGATLYRSECEEHKLCKGNGLKGACCPTPAGVFHDCCGKISSSVSIDSFHGMCYSPMPVKKEVKEGYWRTDDCMAKWARSMWGAAPYGRDDLALIKNLGANVVRMYGLESTSNHQGFLDRAAQLGLGVMVGMSNYPYLQDPTGSCANPPHYDCSDRIEDEYTKLLRGGFSKELPDGLSKDLPDGSRVYHPAIQAIVLMNEPELNIAPIGNSDSRYTKAIISALDGALEAERKLKILPNSKGRMPPFAMVYSIAPCNSCTSNKKKNTVALINNDISDAPGVGEWGGSCTCPNGEIYQVGDNGDFCASLACIGGTSGECNRWNGAWSRRKVTCNQAAHRAVGGISFIPFVYDFVLASLDPASFGYKTTKRRAHRLRAALQNRIAFGFNTPLPQSQNCDFLAYLGRTPLASLPFFVGEYNPAYTYNPANPRRSPSFLTNDMQLLRADMLTGTSSCFGENNTLKGVNFFEFQTSYWKGPENGELEYGLFELGDEELGTTCGTSETNENEYPVWCLRKKRDSDGQSWVGSLAKFYNGSVMDDTGCSPSENAR